MAAVLPRLLRRSSVLRIATPLNQRPPSVLPSILSSYKQQAHSDGNANALESFLDGERPKMPSSQYPSYAYPSFPFGCILDPISLSGFEPAGVEDAEDAPTTVWADSVKKKRKKKMNKHKYKKLRKLLRRKS